MVSVDWFLILIIIVIAVMLLISNVYILVYFQHEDDKNTAYFPKALVIFGLFFAEATVLLLPLDVANNSSAIGCKEGWNKACGNLDMETLWMIVFMSIIFFIVVLLPYCIYYYESDDGENNVNNHRWLEALKMEVCTVLLAAIVMVVLFLTVSDSNVPMHAMQVDALSTSGFRSYQDGAVLTRDDVRLASSVPIEKVRMSIQLSFPVYITGLVSFIGWFAFAIFCGIGLVALPLDLILAFVHRPKFISADVYAHKKLILQRRSMELIELGRTIRAGMEKPGQTSKSTWERRKQKRLDFITINKFKQSVYMLEQDTQDLKMCHEEYRNFNPLIPIAKLILGCIFALISCMWIFHIGLYMVPPVPVVSFLNSYFMWFDQWFPLFGTLSVGFFSTYLLGAAVKGCFKFGMRCFCCALHPMKLHGTYMNSFLFNLGLVLFCSIPAVQFCDEAFKDYGRLTTIRHMMGVQIRYLQGISIFWEYNVFVYAILAFCFLTGVFLSIKPKDNATALDGIRKRIEKQVRTSRDTRAV